MVGQTLSHYKILDKLGAGGMGEVYLAEDTTLKRQVALKVLPPDLAASQERLERFQREAETLAALDHPNIVTIYSVEAAGLRAGRPPGEDSSGKIHFLTMQLVEGKRLSDLIPKTGMPLERIFEIAIPLADALAAAHEKGVIHRDLKPGNIMVTDDGRVKVLDFGLAKLRPELDAGEATSLPTEPFTEEGQILGTVPYMSPEQLEGRELDARTDIFSLGVILYEMATGERPFTGDSSISIITSIIRDTPEEIDTLRTELPHHLARIIRHCLEKEARRRYQSALDVSNELEDLKTESASGDVWRVRTSPSSRRRAMLWGGLAAAGILLLAALAVVYWNLRSDQAPGVGSPAPGTGTFTKLVFDTSEKGKVSASPDGRFFAYASDASGNWDIYLQRIRGGNAINLTEDSPDDDFQPAFSPDGESIAFRSERDGGGIYVMGATGESVRRVTDHGLFPDWSPDGLKIVFSTGTRFLGQKVAHIYERIWVVSLSTGKLQMLLDRSGSMPVWSPNGLHVAYFGIWEPSGSESQYDLFAVSADGGEPVRLTSDAHFETSPAWSSDGDSLYYVSDRSAALDLWKLSIDETTGEVRGDPEPVTSGSSVAFVSPSGTESVLYSSSTTSREILRVPFDPVAESVVGPPVSLTPPGLRASNPSVSPDGEWIAFNAEFGHPGSIAIGIIRTDGSGLRQLTESGHRDVYPRWSPDGRRLTFYSKRSGTSQAWIISADGSGLRQLTDTPALQVMTPTWSPDGLRLATNSLDCKTTYIFRADKTWSQEAPSQLPPSTEADGTFCPWSWSPDGNLLAGHHGQDEGVALFSFASGSYEVLASGFGGWPLWLADSRRIFFMSSGETTDSVFSILDTVTGEHHEVLSSRMPTIGPDPLRPWAAISPDNRSIYFAQTHDESAIWMLSFDQQP